MADKKYIRVSNQWFDLVDGKNLSLLYGSRGFTLQAKMMQRLNVRGLYDLTDRHIQQWFGYTNYREIKNIFTILDMFRRGGLINCSNDYDFAKVCTDVVVFQPTDILLPSSEYFIVYDYEIDTILIECAVKLDKFKLFLLFGCLKYHYNTNMKFAYPSIELLASETGLSHTTILMYLDILVDLGLILYDNPGTKLFLDGSVKECNNIYTMNYKGNEAILKQEIGRVVSELQEQEKQQKLKLTNNVIGNKRRGICTTQRHLRNRFDKGLISRQEYDIQFIALEDEYNKLVAKQNYIRKQIK